MASLIRIRVLCKAGSKIVFNDEKCEVFYNNDIILQGYKDQTTDLWTLPITHNEVAKTTQESLSECAQFVGVCWVCSSVSSIGEFLFQLGGFFLCWIVGYHSGWCIAHPLNVWYCDLVTKSVHPLFCVFIHPLFWIEGECH